MTNRTELAATAGVAKYHVLAGQLKELICAGEVQPGERLPSYASLRRRYGISQATFEKACGVLEADGLIVRRQGSGTFVAEPRAAAPAILGVTGFWFDQSAQYPYWLELVGGVQRAASEHGYQILFVDSREPAAPAPIAGLISLNTSDSPSHQAHRLGVPTISLVHGLAGFDCIMADDYRAGRLAGEHLLALGHRRIAALLHPGGVGARREQGCRAALADAGVELVLRSFRPGPDPAIGDEENSLLVRGRESMRAWLAEGWRELGCTAIVAHNDDVAMAVIGVLGESGLRVPEDVSVVGFDGSGADRHFTPALTTVELPLREIGAAGVERLLARLAGDARPTTATVLPVRLRVRDSTQVLPSVKRGA